MIWDKKNETARPEDMRREQSANLRALVAKLHEKVPFYRAKLEGAGVKPEDIKSIEDIAKLPFTTKDEMRDVYPYGLLAVDQSEIAEVHMSSGTTGKPVVDAYTLKDLDIWSETMARTLSMGGIGKEDTLHNAYGYGLFTGGMGAHYGGRRVGANVLPVSGGNTQRQLMVLQDFKPTAITCTPSYSLYLAEYARENGVDPRKLSLKAGFFGAEPWSETMRQEIEEKLGLKAYDIYGLTEIIGPGVAAECERQDGLHFFEDHFYPEIINPGTGELVPEGETGELVITTLTKEGTPLIRYRTRDITHFLLGDCPCGRTQRRIHRLLGRTDDLLIIRGVNIFPSQIEQALFKFEGIEPHYQLVVDRKDHLDTLEVQVEMNEQLFSDEIRRLAETERHIEGQLHSALGIHAKVKLVNPKSIARSEGKAKRIVDKRKL